MSQASKTTEHLVIGGGLAGAMVGLRLAAAGREVTLLERERTAHHKVCGEFLSREAVDYLRQAGIDPQALGATTIRFVRLAVKRTLVEADLPFTALSLSRHVLDEALLARTAEVGCNVQRGSSVERLIERGSSWNAEVRGEDSWLASTVFLGNGKHDLRGFDRDEGVQGDLVGFKMHWQLALSQAKALHECMELFLFTGGYGGLSMVENGVTALCLVVKRSELRKDAGWNGLLASIVEENLHIAQRLQGATALWERPLAISSIPYGHLAQRSSKLWRIGDQAAVIPSFTGDGMSIALHSANLAAQMCLTGRSADEYQQMLNSQLRRGMTLATWLSRGMVTSVGRGVAPLGLSLFPGSLRWIASSTRIPDQAMSYPAIAHPKSGKRAVP